MAYAHGNRIDVAIGERIRNQREAAGFSLSELAALAQLSVRDLSRFESGAARLPAPALIAIAVCLGAPISSFFKGIEEQLQAPREFTPTHSSD